MLVIFQPLNISTPREKRECYCRLQWDLPVSAGFNPVHPIGHPIHHSANAGVRRCPSEGVRIRSCDRNRFCVKIGKPSKLNSSFKAVRKFNPPWRRWERPGPPIPSDFVNVGIFLSAVASPSPLFCDAPFLFQFPQTVIVGSKAPPSISLMARADMRGSKRSITPGISPLHKGADDLPPAFCSDSRGVFKEDDWRFDNVNCFEQLPNKS
jgi:hypothetical protein